MRRILTIAAIGLLAGCTTTYEDWETRDPYYMATTQGNYIQFLDCVEAQYSSPVLHDMEIDVDESNETIHARFPRPHHPVWFGKHEIPLGGLYVRQIDPNYIHVEYRRGVSGGHSFFLRIIKICVA